MFSEWLTPFFFMENDDALSCYNVFALDYLRYSQKCRIATYMLNYYEGSEVARCAPPADSSQFLRRKLTLNCSASYAAACQTAMATESYFLSNRCPKRFILSHLWAAAERLCRQLHLSSAGLLFTGYYLISHIKNSGMVAAPSPSI